MRRHADCRLVPAFILGTLAGASASILAAGLWIFWLGYRGRAW